MKKQFVLKTISYIYLLGTNKYVATNIFDIKAKYVVRIIILSPILSKYKIKKKIQPWFSD